MTTTVDVQRSFTINRPKIDVQRLWEKAHPIADELPEGCNCSVRFDDAPGGRGTEIHVHLNYDAPLGKISTVLSKLFGDDPEANVRESLRHFKQMIETGEIPSTEGQPNAAH